MGKILSEIDVLHYFEEGPIEKAELLFNIVSMKMRERLGRNKNAGSRSKEKDAGQKRRVGPSVEPPSSDTLKSEPLT